MKSLKNYINENGKDLILIEVIINMKKKWLIND